MVQKGKPLPLLLLCFTVTNLKRKTCVCVCATPRYAVNRYRKLLLRVANWTASQHRRSRRSGSCGATWIILVNKNSWTCVCVCARACLLDSLREQIKFTPKQRCFPAYHQRSSPCWKEASGVGGAGRETVNLWGRGDKKKHNTTGS